MVLLLSAILMLLRILGYLLLARVIISWLPIPKENQLIRVLYQVTEPILAPIRAMIEKSSLGRNTMFDFSVIIAYLLINLAISLISSLY